jgi:hypothetical protein
VIPLLSTPIVRTQEALKTFILKLGVTKQISVTDVALLDDCIRDNLDPQAEPGSPVRMRR